MILNREKFNEIIMTINQQNIILLKWRIVDEFATKCVFFYNFVIAIIYSTFSILLIKSLNRIIIFCNAIIIFFNFSTRFLSFSRFVDKRSINCFNFSTFFCIFSNFIWKMIKKNDEKNRDWAHCNWETKISILKSKKKTIFVRSTIEKNETQVNVTSLFDIYINLKNFKL